MSDINLVSGLVAAVRCFDTPFGDKRYDPDPEDVLKPVESFLTAGRLVQNHIVENSENASFEQLMTLVSGRLNGRSVLVTSALGRSSIERGYFEVALTCVQVPHGCDVLSIPAGRRAPRRAVAVRPGAGDANLAFVPHDDEKPADVRRWLDEAGLVNLVRAIDWSRVGRLVITAQGGFALRYPEGDYASATPEWLAPRLAALEPLAAAIESGKASQPATVAEEAAEFSEVNVLAPSAEPWVRARGWAAADDALSIYRGAFFAYVGAALLFDLLAVPFVGRHPSPGALTLVGLAQSLTALLATTGMALGLHRARAIPAQTRARPLLAVAKWALLASLVPDLLAAWRSFDLRSAETLGFDLTQLAALGQLLVLPAVALTASALRRVERAIERPRSPLFAGPEVGAAWTAVAMAIWQLARVSNRPIDLNQAEGLVAALVGVPLVVGIVLCAVPYLQRSQFRLVSSPYRRGTLEWLWLDLGLAVMWSGVGTLWMVAVGSMFLPLAFVAAAHGFALFWVRRAMLPGVAEEQTR